MSKKQHSDLDALAALIRGQEDGLDHFFNLYYASLSYFAFRLLQDKYLAEEVASEAFIKLWKHRNVLSEVGSIKSWLYTSVRNTSIDHLRKVKRLRISEEGLQTPEMIEKSVLHRMIETETIRQIIDTLEFLPPKCSHVFKMFFIQGKSYDEIARELKISPHTVRNQKDRAIRLIKEKFPFYS